MALYGYSPAHSRIYSDRALSYYAADNSMQQKNYPFDPPKEEFRLPGTFNVDSMSELVGLVFGERLNSTITEKGFIHDLEG